MFHLNTISLTGHQINSIRNVVEYLFSNNGKLLGKFVLSAIVHIVWQGRVVSYFRLVQRTTCAAQAKGEGCISSKTEIAFQQGPRTYTHMHTHRHTTLFSLRFLSILP